MLAIKQIYSVIV